VELSVRIGACKVAFDHCLDVELADLVRVAIAMNPHDTTRPFPYLFLMSGI